MDQIDLYLFRKFSDRLQRIGLSLDIGYSKITGEAKRWKVLDETRGYETLVISFSHDSSLERWLLTKEESLQQEGKKA